MDDEKLKGNHACEYPSYGLDKLVSGKFAKSGSPALKVIRKFKWTSADQNFVANLISGKKMAKDKAAAAWVARTRPRSTPGSSELSEVAGARLALPPPPSRP